MIFLFYLGAMALAIALSLFNLRRGDRRLSELAIGYFFIVAGFHLIFMTWLGLGWRDLEFYPLVAGAQGLVFGMSRRVGCRAAQIIMPLAIAAIWINCLTFVVLADYPHSWYYMTMNVIQCAQIGSMIFASRMWFMAAEALGFKERNPTDGMKRVAHERSG